MKIVPSEPSRPPERKGGVLKVKRLIVDGNTQNSVQHDRRNLDGRVNSIIRWDRPGDRLSASGEQVELYFGYGDEHTIDSAKAVIEELTELVAMAEAIRDGCPLEERTVEWMSEDDTTEEE